MDRQSIRACRRLAALIILVPLSTSRPVAQSDATTAVVLPANTAIAIRTIDLIDSEQSPPNKEYRATTDDSIVVGDLTVAPVGTPAFVQIVRTQQAGAVNGRAGVTLRLVALELNGQRVRVSTGDAAIQSGSQAAKAAKAGAGGAAIGALLGAVLGGKKGAVEGAAAGAAVGVTAAVVSGQRVHVPAETRLSFTLAAPVRVPRALLGSPER